LRQIQSTDKNRVYWTQRFLDEPIVTLFKEYLSRQGFLVIADNIDRVYFRSGKSVGTDHENVLKILSKRYDFELRSIREPWASDIQSLLVPHEELSLPIQQIIRDIRRIKKGQLRVGRLRDAPAAFNLAGLDYLNLDHDAFKKVNANAEAFGTHQLRSYILGLLQLDLD
jgi:hypothetical protein